MRRDQRAIVTMFSIAVCLAAAVASVRDLRRDPGWHDFRAMCSALDDFARGEPTAAYSRRPPDPILSVTYPPLALEPLRPVCGSEVLQRLAWAAAIVVSAAALALAFSSVNPMLIVALTFTGFRAVTWILWTGNIAAIDLLLMSLGALALAQGRHRIAGALLGIAGFFRLFPLLFIPAFAIGTPRRQIASLFLSGIGTFVLLHAASMALLPQASAAYWSALAGGFGGSIGEEIWFGSTTHPSMYSAALAIARRLPHTLFAGRLLYAIGALAAIAAFGVVWRRSASTNVAAGLRWSAVVLVLLISPRLKPYNLGLVLPSLCFAASTFGPPGQVGVLIAFSAIPFVAFESTGLYARAYLLGYTELVMLAALYGLLLAHVVSASDRSNVALQPTHAPLP